MTDRDRGAIALAERVLGLLDQGSFSATTSASGGFRKGPASGPRSYPKCARGAVRGHRRTGAATIARTVPSGLHGV